MNAAFKSFISIKDEIILMSASNSDQQQNDFQSNETAPCSIISTLTIHHSHSLTLQTQNARFPQIHNLLW